MRVFVGDQEKRLPSVLICTWRKLWRLRPWRAYGFACIVLARTSKGPAGPRVLEGAHCRCWAPSDLTGSFIVKILHCGEGGNVKQVT